MSSRLNDAGVEEVAERLSLGEQVDSGATSRGRLVRIVRKSWAGIANLM